MQSQLTHRCAAWLMMRLCFFKTVFLLSKNNIKEKKSELEKIQGSNYNCERPFKTSLLDNNKSQSLFQCLLVNLMRSSNYDEECFLFHVSLLSWTCFQELLPMACWHARTKIENVGVLLMDGILWYQSNIHNHFSCVTVLTPSNGIIPPSPALKSLLLYWQRSANCWVKVMKWPTFKKKKKKIKLKAKQKPHKVTCKQAETKYSIAKFRTQVSEIFRCFSL